MSRRFSSRIDARNLVVIHNMTADNLLHAKELGGLPAPSIAVSRVEHPIDTFGEISLLGGPSLIDPKTGTPVFDADVYSPRWPDSEREVDNRKASALIKELAPFAEQTGNSFMLEPSDLSKEDTADIVTGGSWVEVLGAAYIKEKGIETTIPKFDPGLSYGEKKQLGKDYGNVVRDIVRSKEHRDDYEKWALAKVSAALGSRKIVKYSDSGRTKRIPYTLENILKEMTKKIRAGEQFNYGLGTARSNGAKRFRSIEQIQKARDRVVAREDFEKLKNENQEKFFELAAKLAAYHPAHKSGTSFGSLDSASMAIGDSYRKGASMRSALRENGYDTEDMPTELMQEAANFAAELIAMPTQYFEAKPQRAVHLSEFTAAVVPVNAPKEVFEILKRAGLDVTTYDKSDTDLKTGISKAREDAVRQAAEASDILFQKDSTNEARGWIKIMKKGAARQFRIFMTKHADASTFLHESAHAMFEMYEQIASSPNPPAKIARDWATMRKWVKAEDGAELTEAQKEQMARGFEAYVLEGKAPSAALAEAFASFARWLKDIYKSVAKLGVELNDDVRGVFDRMLATENEIAQARFAAGLSTPVFMTPQQAGVDPKDFDAYLRGQERARATIIARVQQAIHAGKLRAAKAFRTEEFRRIKEKNEAAYDQLPQTKAWRYMIMGEITLPNGDKDRNTGRGRMDRDEVYGVLGRDSNLARSMRHRMVKNGESIVDVADLFGFAGGGAEMLRSMASLPEKSDWVQAESEREMKALHPEIDGEIADLQAAIQKLQHVDSDEAEREWQMIKRNTKDQMTLEALARAAKLQVDNRTVDRLDPGVILNRERAFAQRSADAAIKGNFDEAQLFANRRVLHKYLYKELVAAREMREEYVDTVSEMKGDGSRARLGLAGAEYRDIIDTLLEALGASIVRPGAEERADLGRLMGKMALDGNTVAFDPILIGRLIAKPQPWKTLKVEELRGVLEALKNVRAAARNVTTMLKDGKRVDIEELIQKLIATADTHIARALVSSSSEDAESEFQRMLRLGASYDGILLRPETMLEFLGWDQGETNLVQPLQDAKYKAGDFVRETAAPIVKLFDKIPSKIRSRLMENIDGRALFPGHIPDPSPLSKRYQLLMLALNMGNTSNQERLLGGRNITADQAMRAMEMLTREELEWVQTVWDQIETLWPHLKALEERDSGLPLEKIQAKPLTVNGLDMRGGYFPAVYDNRYGVGLGRGWLNELSSASDALDMSAGRYPTTNKSASKKRATKYEDVISLNPSTIQSHIVRVTHDIAFREVIRSHARIFLDPRIKQVLKQKLGAERAKMFEPWLRDIGRLEASQIDDHGDLPARFLRALKSNLPVAVLGHAVDNYLGDTTGWLTVAIGSGLNKSHYGDGLADYTLHPFESRKMALEKSGELRSRSDETQGDLSRRLKSISKGRIKRGEAFIRQHAFFFAEQLEKAIVTPIWIGAYKQGLAENRGEKGAIEFADGLVRKSFPAKNVVDRSAIQRDKGFFGSMFAFVGYANWAYNQHRRVWHPVFEAQGLKDKASSAVSAMLSHAALMLIIGPFAELLVGHGPEDGDGKDDLERWLRWSMRKLLVAHLMPLPLVGGLAEKALGASKVSVRSAPALAVVEAIEKAANRISDADDAMDVVLGLLQAYGYAKGLPTVRPTRIMDYLTEGDYDNVGGLPSGVLYGERKNQPDNLIKMVDRALE
jgi:hypothetical protein